MCLKRYARFYNDLGPAYDELEKMLEKNIHKKGIDLNTYMKAGTQYHQERLVMNEYLTLIGNLGDMWAVPSLINDHTILFNCAKEAQMVKGITTRNFWRVVNLIPVPYYNMI